MVLPHRQRPFKAHVCWVICLDLCDLWPRLSERFVRACVNRREQSLEPHRAQSSTLQLSRREHLDQQVSLTLSLPTPDLFQYSTAYPPMHSKKFGMNPPAVASADLKQPGAEVAPESPAPSEIHSLVFLMELTLQGLVALRMPLSRFQSHTCSHEQRTCSAAQQRLFKAPQSRSFSPTVAVAQRLDSASSNPPRSSHAN